MVTRLQNQGYFWSNMYNDCNKIRMNCMPCHNLNQQHEIKFITNHNIDAVEVFEWLQIDLTGIRTASSDGSTYILVIVDMFSGFVIAKTFQNKDSTPIGNYLIEIFSILGFPKIIQSDNGGEFSSDYFADLCQKYAIEHRFSASYKPNSNGLVERSIGSFKSILNKLCLEFGDANWHKLIPSVTYAINSRIRDDTKSSPFSIFFKRSCTKGTFGIDYSSAKPDPFFNDWLNSTPVQNIIQQFDEEIKLCRLNAKAKIIHQLEQNRGVHEPLAIGTNVFIRTSPQSKTDIKFKGPFVVVGHDERKNHILRTKMGGPQANVTIDKHFPLEQLKPINYDAFQEFENYGYVESIHGERTPADDGETFYHVKFVGGDRKMWVAESDIFDKQLIKVIRGNNNSIVTFRKPKITLH